MSASVPTQTANIERWDEILESFNTESRLSYRALFQASVDAINDHYVIGAGPGVDPKADLAWRLGTALNYTYPKRMPYRHKSIRWLIEVIAYATNNACDRSFVYKAKRFATLYPLRTDIPRGACWSDIERAGLSTRNGPHERLVHDYDLRAAMPDEIRQWVLRGIARVHPEWTSLSRHRIFDIAFSDGPTTITVQVAKYNGRAPSPIVLGGADDSGDTSLALEWSSKPVWRLLRRAKKHRGDSESEFLQRIADAVLAP